MSKQQPEVWKKKLLVALEKTMGIVTPACKEVGISRDRFYTYYNDDPEFKRAVDDIQDIQTDFVEGQLFRKIREGSERSILFYMRYKGRKRGYSESVDITSAGDKLNSDVKIIFVDGDKGNGGLEEDADQ
jgi:hypothetical protein